MVDFLGLSDDFGILDSREYSTIEPLVQGFKIFRTKNECNQSMQRIRFTHVPMSPCPSV